MHVIDEDIRLVGVTQVTQVGVQSAGIERGDTHVPEIEVFERCLNISRLGLLLRLLTLLIVRAHIRGGHKEEIDEHRQRQGDNKVLHLSVHAHVLPAVTATDVDNERREEDSEDKQHDAYHQMKTRQAVLRVGEQRTVRETIRRECRQMLLRLHLRRHKREQIGAIRGCDRITSFVRPLATDEPAIVRLEWSDEVVRQAFTILREEELERDNGAHRVVANLRPAPYTYCIVKPPEPPVVIADAIQAIGYEPVMRPKQQLLVVIYIKDDIRMLMRKRKQGVETVLR